MIVAYADTVAKQVDEKSVRRVLAHGKALMLVEYRFKKGGVGAIHKHDNHDQVGYVAQGRFEIIVGGEKKLIAKGDTYYAAPGVPHGVVALEDDSVLVDTFTPAREDFL